MNRCLGVGWYGIDGWCAVSERSVLNLPHTKKAGVLPTLLVQNRRSHGVRSMPGREPNARLAQLGVGLTNRTNVELLPQLDDEELDRRLICTSVNEVVETERRLILHDQHFDRCLHAPVFNRIAGATGKRLTFILGGQNGFIRRQALQKTTINLVIMKANQR